MPTVFFAFLFTQPHFTTPPPNFPLVEFVHPPLVFIRYLFYLTPFLSILLFYMTPFLSKFFFYPAIYSSLYEICKLIFYFKLFCRKRTLCVSTLCDICIFIYFHVINGLTFSLTLSFFPTFFCFPLTD